MKPIQLTHSFVYALCVPLLALLTFLFNPTLTFAQDDAIFLSGRVTDEADGTPIPGVQIRLWDTGGPGYFDVAVTDSSGYYTVTEAINQQIPTLIPGKYLLNFVPTGVHVAEYYNDTVDLEAATPLTLTLDTPTTIDATLVEGGQIQGKITAQENNQPLSSTSIHLYTLDGEEVANYFNFNPDVTGVYTATGIPPGTYKVRVEPPFVDNFHVSAYYPNQLTFADAEAIEISPGEVMTGVDFSLILGGRISGTLTSDTNGARVFDPEFKVYDESGELFTNWRPSTYSNEPNYAIRNLPPGNFKLFFGDKQELHRSEFFDNQPTIAAATPISITAGSTTEINTVLAYIPRVISIATSSQLTDVILLTLIYNPTPRFTLNGGRAWEEAQTTPWVAPDPTSAPSIGLARRIEQDFSIRMLMGADQYVNPRGIYRSGNKGQSWDNAAYPTRQCNRQSFSNAVASLQAPTKLYLLYTCITDLFLSTISATDLLVSTDAGLSWQNTYTESLSYSWISQLLVSPVVPDRVYGLYSDTWFQSDNAGKDRTFKEFPVRQLALDAQDADLLNGITFYDPSNIIERVGKRSEDGGTTWTDWPQQPCPMGDDSYMDAGGNVQLMAHPTQTKILFVRCDQGLYRSNNSGDSWTQLESTPGQLLAPDYGNPGRIIWGKDDGLWASTDNGDTWQAIMPNYALIAPNFTPFFLPAISTND